MFSEHGYEAVSVRDICANVGVNHGLIKYYFGDKESLWRAVIELATSRLYQTLSEHLEGYSTGAQTPQEAMERWLRGYVYASAMNVKYMRLLSLEALRHSERLDWLIKAFFKQNQKDGISHLQSLIDAGVLPNVSVVSLFYIVSAAVQAPFVVAPKLMKMHGVDMMHKDAIRAHADAIVALLLREPTGGGNFTGRTGEGAAAASKPTSKAKTALVRRPAVAAVKSTGAVKAASQSKGSTVTGKKRTASGSQK